MITNKPKKLDQENEVKTQREAHTITWNGEGEEAEARRQKPEGTSYKEDCKSPFSPSDTFLCTWAILSHAKRGYWGTQNTGPMLTEAIPKPNCFGPETVTIPTAQLRTGSGHGLGCGWKLKTLLPSGVAWWRWGPAHRTKPLPVLRHLRSSRWPSAFCTHHLAYYLVETLWHSTSYYSALPLFAQLIGSLMKTSNMLHSTL